MQCECGCEWEGEDEVTQWLIEEAAFVALEVEDARHQREATQEHQAEQHLLARHAELTAMRDAQKVGA